MSGIIMHPRDYRRLRNLAVLHVELGARACDALLGTSAWVAIPEMFRELAA
jgi:hypothetical protein